MAGSTTWQLVPITPAFGAEIRGIDCNTALDDGEVDQLLALFYQYGLLLFRDQVLEADDQIRFLSYFGTVADEDKNGKHHAVLSTDREGTIAVRDPLGFHQDYSFTEVSPPVISLYAEEAEPDSTRTSFCSGTHAYDTLPAELRNQIADRNALHLRPIESYTVKDRIRLMDLEEQGLSLSDCLCATWPLALRHPKTNVPILYTNRRNVSHVLDMEETESEDLLQALFSHVEGSGTYEHQWRPSDLLVWDNLALQHARFAVSPAKRALRRVVVNEAPMGFIVSPKNEANAMSDVGTAAR